jgi:hypothetical protein
LQLAYRRIFITTDDRSEAPALASLCATRFPKQVSNDARTPPVLQIIEPKSIALPHIGHGLLRTLNYGQDSTVYFY